MFFKRRKNESVKKTEKFLTTEKNFWLFLENKIRKLLIFKACRKAYKKSTLKSFKYLGQGYSAWGRGPNPDLLMVDFGLFQNDT